MHVHNISKKWSRLDQVFISEEHMDVIISCKALSHTPGINTDHLPILTTLDLDLARALSNPLKNFRNVDWEEFDKALSEKLYKLGPPSCIHTPGELETVCSKLTEAIQDTINNKVPTSSVRIKAKKWWTKELKKLQQEANRKGQRASKYKDWPDHQVHAERHKANKIFQKTLECTKQQHWHDWLERAEDPDIWTAHRYMAAPAGDGGKSRIPVLKLMQDGQEHLASTNEEKRKLIAKTFFPPKPPNNTLIHFIYPKPLCTLGAISREQIKWQLAKLKPYKAPGPNSIPNIILTKCTDILMDRLFYIYKAILDLGVYYDPWKLSTMVVLWKPGKLKYNIPKVYR
jgi:hypothetical protein